MSNEHPPICATPAGANGGKEREHFGQGDMLAINAGISHTAAPASGRDASPALARGARARQGGDRRIAFVAGTV
jgi:hypothetical protein